jgi:hypothetical protein
MLVGVGVFVNPSGVEVLTLVFVLVLVLVLVEVSKGATPRAAKTPPGAAETIAVTHRPRRKEKSSAPATLPKRRR